MRAAIDRCNGDDGSCMRCISGGFFFRGVNDAGEKNKRDEGCGMRDAGTAEPGAQNGHGESETVFRTRSCSEMSLEAKPLYPIPHPASRYTHTRFRPPAFARYSAWSAQSSRSSAVST